MRRQSFAALATAIAGVGLLLVASPASACTISFNEPADKSPKAERAAAVRNIAEASVIVDGVVLRSQGRTARIYARRVLKGPVQKIYEVEYSMCGRYLHYGERERFFLYGGPRAYTVGMDNPTGWPRARVYDRLLKSDRRRLWPRRYANGARRPGWFGWAGLGPQRPQRRGP